MPNVNFGVAGLNLANMPTLGVEGRYPFFGENDIWNSSVNLTKVMGSHNMKVGLFYEYTTRPAARSTQFNGSFNFDRNTANPLDANHPYANALIGSVNSYSEATGHPDANARFRNVEWFIQDSWRVKPNFTIDAGIRFYRIGPTISAGDQLAVFDPEAYNLNAGAAVHPAGQHAAGPPRPQPADRRDPAGGEDRHLRAELGDAVQRHARSYEDGLLDTPPIQVAPRIGFSWDVTGDGRTAVRGGFGIFPDRFNDDIVLQHVELPPHRPDADRQLHDDQRAAVDAAQPEPGDGARAQSATTSRSRSRTGASASSATSASSCWPTSPTSGRSADGMLQTRNINAVPYGDELPGRRASTRRPAAPLPANFLRPYRGYGDILVSEFAGFSDYHALQVAVNRRYTRGFRMGVAYTLSDAKNVGASSTAEQPDRQPVPRHP